MSGRIQGTLRFHSELMPRILIRATIYDMRLDNPLDHWRGLQLMQE